MFMFSIAGKPAYFFVEIGRKKILSTIDIIFVIVYNNHSKLIE